MKMNWVIGLLAMLTCMGSVYATDFQPTDDTYVSQWNPTDNYASNTTLYVRSGATSGEQIPYLKFDVSGMIGDIVSAKLVLYSSFVVGDVTAYAVSDTNWTEGSLTWDNRPAPGTALSTETCAANTLAEFDVTAAVTGNGTFAFCLKDYGTDVSHKFKSRDANISPVLRITANADWQIVDPIYPTHDTIVAGIVLDSRYLPANPSTTDCSDVINRAIQELENAGGGIVFLPAGEYLCSGTIDLAENVVLRGDVRAVSGADKSVAGTVLKVTYDGRDGIDRSFIRMEDRSGLDHLTIWYPNQDLSSVVPYAATIDGRYEADGVTPRSTYEASIKDVNLVNSYIGLAPKENFVRADLDGLYGSPIHLGMYQQQSSDVPSYMNVSLSAAYWAESGLPGAPTLSDLRSYLRANATAIKMGASDNIFAAEWHVEDYKIGFHFLNEGYGTLNGNLYALHASNCGTAFQGDELGITFVINSSFQGDQAVVLPNKSHLYFNDCDFNASSQYAVECTWSGSLSKDLRFQNCTFNKPVFAGSTYFSVLDSAFTYSEGAGIELSSKTPIAMILGNTFAYGGTPVELNGANPAGVVFDPTPTHSKQCPTFDINGYNKERKPTANNLIVMGSEGYEVYVDGVTDDAPAIQSALDAAGAQGGGVVFLPKMGDGYAVRTPLNVPDGVELRSCSEGYHSLNYGAGVEGALLQIYHGRNASIPTITLGQGSGFKGFNIHYPEQLSDDAIPYSFTLYSEGDYSYIQNSWFINSYNSMEFNGSDYYLIENIIFTPYNRLVKATNCANGRINNVNGRDEWIGFPTHIGLDFYYYSYAQAVALEIIDCANQEIFRAFNHRSAWLATFENSSAITLQCSMESLRDAIQVNGIPAGGCIDMIGSSLRTSDDHMQGPLSMLDIAAAPGDGEFAMYSSLLTGYPDTVLKATDANVTLQQCYVALDERKVPTHGLVVDGDHASVVRVENCSFYENVVNTEIRPVADKRLELAGNLFAEGFSYSDQQVMQETMDPSALNPATTFAQLANFALPALGTSMNFSSPGEAGVSLLSTEYALETRVQKNDNGDASLTGYYPTNAAQTLDFEVFRQVFDAGSEPSGALVKIFYYDWEAGAVTVDYQLPGGSWINAGMIPLTGDGGIVLTEKTVNPFFLSAEMEVPGEVFQVGTKIRIDVDGKAYFSCLSILSGDGYEPLPFRDSSRTAGSDSFDDNEGTGYSGWTESNFTDGSLPLYSEQNNRLEWFKGGDEVDHLTLNSSSTHSQDVSINVDVSAMDGGGTFYVYFFYQDVNNWYRLKVNDGASSQFEKRIDGSDSSVGAVGPGVDIGNGNALRTWEIVVTSEGTLQFISEGSMILNVSEALSLNSGKIGLGGTGRRPVWDNFSFQLNEQMVTVPDAPTALSALPGIGEVDLDWADNTEPDLASYTVYRSTTSGSGYSAIATGVTASDYLDTTVANHTTYYYVVRAVDFDSNESAQSDESSATPGWVANLVLSDVSVLGTGSGTLSDINQNDDIYQVITEVVSGSTSALEHKWVFDVQGGELVTFYVEAHHSANSEGDDFVFAYSTDDVNYTDMITVTKTADDNTVQWYALPSGLSGTVHIRVVDADRTDSNTQLDSVSVDNLFIVTEESSVAPTMATDPVPATGAVDVSVNVDLSWTAGLMAASHDVYFGTDPNPVFLGNQSGTVFDPGTLLNNTTYYWAADEVNNSGTMTGPVWSFTTESMPNNAPSFTADPFTKPDATAGVSYDEPFSGKAGDPDGDSLTFSKISGPAWLTVDPSGRAMGTPQAGDEGLNSFVVRVTDSGGLFGEAVMEINVLPGVPSWSELTNDDFESGWGRWVSAGADAMLSSSFAIGSQCVNLQDNSTSSEIELASALDLSNHNELKIEFSYAVQSFEGSEDFRILYSSDGGSSWAIIQTYVNDVDFVDDGTRYNPVLNLKSGAYNFTSNVKIKFECDASHNNDDLYIDNIVISAQ